MAISEDILAKIRASLTNAQRAKIDAEADAEYGSGTVLGSGDRSYQLTRMPDGSLRIFNADDLPPGHERMKFGGQK